MEIIKTDENRFDDLQDYPFEPKYVSCDGFQMHTVDEGVNENEVVLMLHGEPTWSFLYRKILPIVRDAGFRVVAPDFIGFAKSDNRWIRVSTPTSSIWTGWLLFCAK